MNAACSACVGCVQRMTAAPLKDLNATMNDIARGRGMGSTSKLPGRQVCEDAGRSMTVCGDAGQSMTVTTCHSACVHTCMHLHLRVLPLLLKLDH